MELSDQCQEVLATDFGGVETQTTMYLKFTKGQLSITL